jgi:arabinan endo-1,5-alpha-L-arabinosidase
MMILNLLPRRAWLLLLIVLVLSGAAMGGVQPSAALTGDIAIHDPSMIEADGCYYAYSTGSTLSIRKTCDLKAGWTNIGSVFPALYGWMFDVIGHVPTDLWAPDINTFNGKYYLYYAGSTFGSNKSVIALATADDPAGPWTDEGEVLHSGVVNNYNAIDPNLVWDDEGQAWLTFGSFWDGIKMRQIDPKTGKLLDAKPALWALASRQGGAIEASSILHASGYYYLFVSFDKCCVGVYSTYRIMVGRSDKVTGPYLDKDGLDMLRGGGTQLLATEGRYIGPGGQDVMTVGDDNWLIYHFYDGEDSGKSKLAMRAITFDADGWPMLGPMQ